MQASRSTAERLQKLHRTYKPCVHAPAVLCCICAASLSELVIVPTVQKLQQPVVHVPGRQMPLRSHSGFGRKQLCDRYRCQHCQCNDVTYAYMAFSSELRSTIEIQNLRKDTLNCTSWLPITVVTPAVTPGHNNLTSFSSSEHTIPLGQVHHI